MFSILRHIWSLLDPFHNEFKKFVILIFFYELLQIAESYLPSLVIRLNEQSINYLSWVVMITGFMLYQEMFMRLDNHLDWHIVSKQINPVFRHLKLKAMAKFFNLDIAWHEDHNSGALVGKVNNGVSKVADIVESLSWEFVPTIMQTILSIFPLLFISAPVVLVAIPAFSLFMWLSIKANRAKLPLRKKRHDLYEKDWHESVQAIQSIETLIMFGRLEGLFTELKEVHDQIVDLGNQEARLGIYIYNRWRIRVLALVRSLILGIWVTQLNSGILSIADFVYVNVLMERLFHSFWRFARLYDRATEASEAAQRLVELMNEQPVVRYVMSRD